MKKHVKRTPLKPYLKTSLKKVIVLLIFGERKI